MPVPEGLEAFEDAWNYAVEVVHHRRLTDTLAKRQMQDIAERYNNSIVFPLDDVEGEPDFPAVAAQIIADSVDGYATRANDTFPTITAPAIDLTAANHRKRAQLRKEAWGAHYHESKLMLKLGRAYRQDMGYGTFCLFTEPDFVNERAHTYTRDPLLTYPEPMGNDELRRPCDIGFVSGRSPQYLIKRYPQARNIIEDNTSADDDLWDVLEWMDQDHIFVGILGKRSTQSYLRRFDAAGNVIYGDYSMDHSFLLSAYPNRAGIVTAVCPQAVTLDRLVSAISRIVPTTDLMNKLAALNFVSAEKGVFPHIVVLGENGLEPEIEGGMFHDGRSGRANLVSNARAIQALNMSPSPQIREQMSDLERAARLSSGNPSVFQGEGSGSIRSGQTVTQLAGYSVDPRLREAHLKMAYALGLVNESVAAIELAYWPGKQYVCFSGWQGVNRHVKYRPADIWEETTESLVAYPMPGMDAQNATIAIASLNQARMMSRRTGMAKHPLIEDSDAEERFIIEETFDDAISMTAVGLVTSGQLAWTDLAIVRAKIRAGMLPEVAIDEAQKEAQQRQATEAPPPQPGMMAAPEQMPGLNAPEAGGQMAPAPSPPGPAPSQAEQFEQVAQALMAAPPAGAPA